jgi:hypothetical protein
MPTGLIYLGKDKTVINKQGWRVSLDNKKAGAKASGLMNMFLSFY